jgi:hypothetical protein
VLAGAVTSADLLSLRSNLELELLDQAADDLRAQLSLADEFVPGSLRIVRVEQERFDRTAGAAAESLGLELSLEVEGLSFRRSVAQAAIEAQLPERLPGGWQLIPGTLSFQAVEPEDQQPDGAAIFGSFQVRADTARQVSFEQIRRLARGAPTARVAGDLSSKFDLLQPPTIQTSPAWLPWLPWLEMQIEVRWPWEGS